MPCTRAITGCGNRVSFTIMRLQASKSSRCHASIGMRAHLLQIVARAKALPRAGDHDGAHLGIARRSRRARACKRVEHRRATDRVEALAAIQRQRAHAVARLGAARRG